MGDVGLSIRAAGSEDRTWFRTDLGSDDLETIYFDERDSRAILTVLLEMETRGADVILGASGDVETVVAEFDITGLALNYQRLPC